MPPGGVNELDDWVSVGRELASKGSVSMSKISEGGGGSKTGCAMCKGTLSNGNSGLNCELKIVIAKGRRKNMYMQTRA